MLRLKYVCACVVQKMFAHALYTAKQISERISCLISKNSKIYRTFALCLQQKIVP